MPFRRRRRRWSRVPHERGNGWMIQTRHFHQTRIRHCLSTSPSSAPSTRSSLLSILQANPELEDVEEATTELNWIISETRAERIVQGNGSELEKDADVEREIEARVRRRGQGEPIQYILGNTDFGPLRLYCRPPILIPRPETADVFTRLAELISSNDHFRLSRANPSGGQERAEKHNKNPVKILDLYTGSGCIALLISHLLQPRLAPHSPPQLQLLGIDLNPLSIHLAHKNAQSLSIPTSSARFVEGDITHPEFPHVLRTQGWWGQVDLILANPPYIPLGEYEGLDLSVRGWEDRGALVGFDRDGLGHYRVLAGMVRGLIEGADVGDEHERTNVRTTPWDLAGLPRLAVEIGDGQGQTVERLLVDESQGYLRRTECWRDGWGRERLVVGWTTG